MGVTLDFWALGRWIACIRTWCFWRLAYKLLDQGPYVGKHLGTPNGKSNVECWVLDTWLTNTLTLCLI